MPGLDARQAALVELMGHLRATGYDFIVPTPKTARWVGKQRQRAKPADLRDIFGWTLPFAPAGLDPALSAMARAAGVLVETGKGLRSTVRIGSVDGRLFAHSSPKWKDAKAVFLGPDSYRFVRFIRQALGDPSGIRRALDLGAGAGVGAIMLAGLAPGAAITASDPNPEALRMAACNAAAAGVELALVEASGLPEGLDDLDLIVANPPYIAGAGALYKAGGDQHGAELSLDLVAQALPRLSPGGRMLLYTGSAVVEGRDTVLAGLKALADRFGCDLAYEELDPDVFGETLRTAAYRGVERIAAVGALLCRKI